MASFSLDAEHDAFRASVRALAETHIAPHAALADETEKFPERSWRAWCAAGFAGLAFPEALGGQGAGALVHAIAVEEVARVCASSSLFVFIPKMSCGLLLSHGSQELIERVVPRVVTGECLASYCLSEANAGSDVSAMRTTAVRDGDTYVLNGAKSWITGAGESHFYTVFCKTDPEAGHRGISAFVIEADAAGFSVGKMERKMGMRGSPTGEIIFNDCVVPAANLIGELGRGFYYAMGALDGSRPLVGAQALGIAQGALDTAVAYVQEREQFGSKIAEFQGVRFMLADMAAQIEAARLLVYRACSLLDEGGTGTAMASASAKLFASDTAMNVTTDVVQLLGGVGYTREMPAERMMRDAKVTQIYEGTNQIQRIVIAKELLG